MYIWGIGLQRQVKNTFTRSLAFYQIILSQNPPLGKFLPCRLYLIKILTLIQNYSALHNNIDYTFEIYENKNQMIVFLVFNFFQDLTKIIKVVDKAPTISEVQRGTNALVYSL